MLTKLISDRRAWRADRIDDRSAWYYPLSSRCLVALDDTLEQLKSRPRPLAEVQVADYLCAACADDLKPALDALENGRGFAIIEGPPPERYTPQEAATLYWLVGQLLGDPFAQNVQGTLLYDVRDTGQDVRYGARFSVTNAESTFHTDNSFGADILDYVGLLCMRTAKSGGLSEVISGFAVHNALWQEDPEALALLYQPFHIDRRGGVKPGEGPTTQLPVMTWDGRELTVRYLRYWIEVGHEKVGQPLTPEQVRALDVLDATMQRRDLIVEFALKPGDMYFINNRWILHNRTAFEDHIEPERRRHLVRLWLKARQGGLAGVPVR